MTEFDRDEDADDDTVLAQLDQSDVLADEDYDPLDEGWSPGESPQGIGAWGVTPRQQHTNEPLSQRLRREIGGRTTSSEDSDGIGDTTDTDGELWDDEVGTRRAGRLVLRDADGFLGADDAGVDGAGATGEEAAMHIVEDDRSSW